MSLLCNAFASMGRRARSQITEEGWRDVASRCAEVLPGAQAPAIANMAHGLINVGAEQDSVAEFYDALELLLCTRPQINDFLNAQGIALIAHSLARHRRPERPLVKVEGHNSPGDLT